MFFSTLCQICCPTTTTSSYSAISNINVANPSDRHAISLKKRIAPYNLHLLSNAHTHHVTYSTDGSLHATCIDLAIVKQPDLVKDFTVSPAPFAAGHHFIHFNYCTRLPPSETSSRYTRSISKISPSTFPAAVASSLNNKLDLESLPHIDLISTDTDNCAVIDRLVAEVTDGILEALDVVAPLRLTALRAKVKPWVTQELRKLMRSRDDAYRSYLRSLSASALARYKQLRRSVKNLLDTAKNTYISNKLASASSPADYWRTLRGIGIASHSTPSPLKFFFHTGPAMSVLRFSVFSITGDQRGCRDCLTCVSLGPTRRGDFRVPTCDTAGRGAGFKKSVRKTLATALVLPHLDYAPAVYDSVTQEQNLRLQRVQNACVRFVYGSIPRTAHITPYRLALGWLSVHRRREMKIALLALEILRGGSPSQLRTPFKLLADHPEIRTSPRRIRPLVYYNAKRTGALTKSFTHTASRILSTLPFEITLANPASTYKKLIFNHLFSLDKNDWKTRYRLLTEKTRPTLWRIMFVHDKIVYAGQIIRTKSFRRARQFGRADAAAAKPTQPRARSTTDHTCSRQPNSPAADSRTAAAESNAAAEEKPIICSIQKQESLEESVQMDTPPRSPVEMPMSDEISELKSSKTVINKRSDMTPKQKWHIAFSKIVMQLNFMCSICRWLKLQTLDDGFAKASDVSAKKSVRSVSKEYADISNTFLRVAMSRHKIELAQERKDTVLKTLILIRDFHLNNSDLNLVHSAERLK
ncbi:unnamed protein product [Trichogramma brassicae]|uniref:Uncharacterized protein n=1 Tax=Trichogramma brassicae TaxID=86971 RepID=A0A6H5IX51_9HYME|nr:unnamed protein product [Trichogramma brassicae]